MIVDLVLREMPSAASVLSGGIFKLFAALQLKWERSTKRTQIHSWGDWTHRTVRNLWRVSLLLNGVSTEFDIDTGAEVSVISETQHQKVGSPSLSLSGKRLRGPSNHSLPVIGCFTGVLKRWKPVKEHTDETAETLFRYQSNRLRK